jgi:hypothetical protein
LGLLLLNYAETGVDALSSETREAPVPRTHPRRSSLYSRCRPCDDPPNRFAVAESLHAPRARQELALFLLKEIKTPADYKEKSFADLLHALELLQFNGETLAENLKEASSALLCALSNVFAGSCFVSRQ